ncbi:hypothetical protein PG996_004941 [Apiospora saccharicola]|uniref:Uncharacterized protein n=1 Tax=Apiospora saccharicola TaxID=335842 RepID=A0ABR1VK30_9PEZI
MLRITDVSKQHSTAARRRLTAAFWIRIYHDADKCIRVMTFGRPLTTWNSNKDISEQYPIRKPCPIATIFPIQIPNILDETRNPIWPRIMKVLPIAFSLLATLAAAGPVNPHLPRYHRDVGFYYTTWYTGETRRSTE